MKRLSHFTWLIFAGLFASILLITGCKTLGRLSPVSPAEQLPPNMMLTDQKTEQFKVPARTPILTSTQDDITISICYWRRTDLDRKYNRGNAVSPFYEREALHQGEKTDVFYVKITNNRDYKILFKLRDKDLKVVDQGDNWYDGLDFDALKERLTLMTRVGGLHVKNGLEIAKNILLETQIARVEDGIPPGKSIEGFVPFYQLKLNAETLDVNIPIEKAPPPDTFIRYQTVIFSFPFTHDRGIRLAQPPPHRH
jgi:hypothetical protein